MTSESTIGHTRSDVIDLIIEVLKDHDTILTELVEKLSEILERLPLEKIKEETHQRKDVLQRLLEIYENKQHQTQ